MINRDSNFREMILRSNRIKNILLGLEALQKKENDKVFYQQLEYERQHTEVKEEEVEEDTEVT